MTSATVHHILCLVYLFLSTLSFAVQIAFGPIRDNEYSSQSTLSQCENFVSVSEGPDLVVSDFPFSAFITSHCLSSGKSIVKYIWWNIPDCVHFTGD